MVHYSYQCNLCHEYRYLESWQEFRELTYCKLMWCVLVGGRYIPHVAINFSKENDFFTSIPFLPNCLFSFPLFILSFPQSCFYSPPLVKGSYSCTVSRLLVFPSFHSIWTTFIFQLPGNNSSNNEVAWKQAISLSFLKDILLPFRKQTFCRTALLTTSMSETRSKCGDFAVRKIHWRPVFSTHLVSHSKLTKIRTWLTKPLWFWNSIG